jgi:hypothetical protein
MQREQDSRTMIRFDETCPESAFALDHEHRDQIDDCLRKDGFRLTPEIKKDFVRAVQASIHAFVRRRLDSEITYREAHEALRNLWLLSMEDDPPVGQLRARISRLPKICIEYLNMRASQVIPEIVAGDNEGFLSWAMAADAERLAEVIQTSADGAKRVSRSRGKGKRSRPRTEPLVFGYARGANTGAVRAGRPRHNAQDDLAMHLAIDWCIATGAEPLPGRSDHRGFGDLVHCVFQWLDEPAADQALRRYWEAVKKHRSPSAEETAFPPS